MELILSKQQNGNSFLSFAGSSRSASTTKESAEADEKLNGHVTARRSSSPRKMVSVLHTRTKPEASSTASSPSKKTWRTPTTRGKGQGKQRANMPGQPHGGEQGFSIEDVSDQASNASMSDYEGDGLAVEAEEGLESALMNDTSKEAQNTCYQKQQKTNKQVQQQTNKATNNKTKAKLF